MYALQPDSLYMHARVADDTDALHRVERILSALNKTMADVSVFTEAQAVDVVRGKLQVKVKMFLGREMQVEIDLDQAEKA